jgi:hypothetical protein
MLAQIMDESGCVTQRKPDILASGNTAGTDIFAFARMCRARDAEVL